MGLFTNQSSTLTIRKDKTSGNLTHTLSLLQLHGDTRVASRQELEQIFKNFDVNSDGQLDQTELRQLVQSLYQAAVARAAAEGAPKFYIQRAADAITSEKGKAAIDKSAKELMRVMDKNGDQRLDPDELHQLLTEEAEKLRLAGTHWRLAPLIDLKVCLDDFVDDRRQLKLFLAGAFAGACARTAGAPLSRITILQQTALSGSAYSGSMINIARQMIQKEGLRAVFRGNLPDVARAAPQQGISFLVYEQLKGTFKGLIQSDGSKQSSGFQDLLCSTLAGGCSGVVSVMCTYPLDLVRTRMAAGGGGNSLAGELRAVVQTDGLFALYRGCPVACAEKFPNLAINFALYDVAKKYSLIFLPRSESTPHMEQNADEVQVHSGHDTVGSASAVAARVRQKRTNTERPGADNYAMLRSLMCGVFAGAVSNAVTFPLDVCMKNLQLDGHNGQPKQYTSAFDCARQIVKRGGFGALYNGLGAQLCKAIPVAATSFWAYDTMKMKLGCTVLD